MQNSVKYLKDYTSLPFVIKTINLHFDIHQEDVVVDSVLDIHPLGSDNVLILDGEAELLSLELNGQQLLKGDYVLTEHQLRIEKVPEKDFRLEIVTRLKPKENKTLMGLYESGGNLFTQCESEGFRKITYFLDRPDIMAEYIVTITADKDKYPVLLSNGNPIRFGETENNRHWITWHDPYKKPSYLFALVAGQLAHKEDVYITRSGRNVRIKFYCRQKDIEKTDFAIESLKRAMQWDEDRFNLEYDLDIFMVVAVDDFNMGAMENKGLNIFNTKYVLATSKTATDRDFSNIESVIGHEYFHNYTGNRVTCRDWFQLTLKEGLTVFREQEFASDMSSRAVRRIEAVKILREFQFIEDAGSLSHPVRPEAYEQINNFYTTTVYEKGAEVVRMLHVILGEDGFQKGMQLYFERHDGQAVTCEDFFSAMVDANSMKIPQFLRWYSYAGTPIVKVKKYFDKDQKEVLIKLKQNIPGGNKKPLLIPIKMGFLTDDGRKQSYQIKNIKQWQDENVLLLKNRKAEIKFRINTNQNPILSIGRGFSAPIKLEYKQSENELLTLMLHDSDEFIRWESSQKLYKKYIKKFLKAKKIGKKYPSISGFSSKINQMIETENNYALLSLMLVLPSFNELLEANAPIDPVLLQKVIEDFKSQIALYCFASIESKYNLLLRYEASDPFGVQERYHPELEWVRALINVFRSYLIHADKNYFDQFTRDYEQISTNMTHRIGLLDSIKHIDSKAKEALLDSFAKQFESEDLVLDKYFNLIASSFAKDTFKNVKKSLKSPYFDLTNPNKVRALLVTFTRNPIFFHQINAQGYQFIAKLIVKIEKFNPMMASRLVDSFKVVNMLDDDRQKIIQKKIKWLLRRVTSSDVIEVATKIYESI
ncbi:MAG: aminopeptidase N [Neisseriaceae bacterium]|nr:MAG: aminopeptidase N [Neisseriaceae bacterium]